MNRESAAVKSLREFLSQALGGIRCDLFRQELDKLAPQMSALPPLWSRAWSRLQAQLDAPQDLPPGYCRWHEFPSAHSNSFRNLLLEDPSKEHLFLHFPCCLTSGFFVQFGFQASWEGFLASPGVETCLNVKDYPEWSGLVLGLSSNRSLQAHFLSRPF